MRLSQRPTVSCCCACSARAFARGNSVQEYVQPSPLYTHVQLHVQTQDVQVLGLRHRPQQYADTPLATSAPNKANPKAPHAEAAVRSEEHTSELQSRGYIVCRLLLEK